METTEFDFEDRMVSTEYTGVDSDIELSLRPKQLEDYIGQEKAKDILSVYIDSAKLRGEPLDHVLLYGPPGPSYLVGTVLCISHENSESALTGINRINFVFKRALISNLFP